MNFPPTLPSLSAASRDPAQRPDRTDATLRKTAQDFETAFLAETLKSIGLDGTHGVAGAAAFSSFLNRAYAEKLVERGGIGLSDSLYEALKHKQNAGETGA